MYREEKRSEKGAEKLEKRERSKGCLHPQEYKRFC